MGPVISQFGLSSDVTTAANTGDMQNFFKALEGSSNTGSTTDDDKKKEEDKKAKDSKKDEDDGMPLD